jgi:K(+)-stimulated pyrophosphate-energized sodium pump
MGALYKGLIAAGVLSIGRDRAREPRHVRGFSTRFSLGGGFNFTSGACSAAPSSASS